MAIAKNQHYVPQFYLRHFSIDKKMIDTYEIGKNKFTKRTIEKECSKPYFYSKSKEVEGAFSKMEDRSARIIKKIIEASSLTVISKEEYMTLLFYICFQYGRTDVMGKRVLEFANKLWQLIAPEEIKDVIVQHQHPATDTTLISLTSAPLLHDLCPVLLVNKTKKEYITSDSPVVLFNSYFSSRGIGGGDGFACKGLQIIFPLSPNLLLFLYDPQYYSCQINRNAKGSVIKNKDIRRLNVLQYLYSYDRLYFQNPALSKYILDISKDYVLKRNNERSEVNKLSVGDRNIIRSRSKEIKYNFTLTFLKKRKDAIPTKGLRDLELVKQHKEYTNQLLKEKSSL